MKSANRLANKADLDCDAEPTMFLYSHASNIDVTVMLYLLPNHISYLAKASLLKLPVMGRLLEYGETVPIVRENLGEAKLALSTMEEKLNKGRHVAIAPEGGRRWKISDPKIDNLLEFKKGPFHVAKHTGVRLVPVLISGTSRVMGKGASFNTPGTIYIRFLNPISSDVVRSGISYEELRQLTKQIFVKNMKVRTDEEVLGQPGYAVPWLVAVWVAHFWVLWAVFKCLFLK